MSTIAVPMPEEDLRFLRTWTEQHGSTAEAFLAQQARNLREHIQRGLHPDVKNAMGVILEDIDAAAEYRAHLDRKHG